LQRIDADGRPLKGLGEAAPLAAMIAAALLVVQVN
jgi:hypothetical protein